MADIPTYALNDGTTLPVIGFGTYPLSGEDGTAAIVSALDAGYRLIDTAVNYDNEVEVGEAIRRLGGTISATDMRRMNYAVDGEKQDPAGVVRAFLDRIKR